MKKDNLFQVVSIIALIIALTNSFLMNNDNTSSVGKVKTTLIDTVILVKNDTIIREITKPALSLKAKLKVKETKEVDAKKTLFLDTIVGQDTINLFFTEKDTEINLNVTYPKDTVQIINTQVEKQKVVEISKNQVEKVNIQEGVFDGVVNYLYLLGVGFILGILFH